MHKNRINTLTVVIVALLFVVPFAATGSSIANAPQNPQAQEPATLDTGASSGAGLAALERIGPGSIERATPVGAVDYSGGDLTLRSDSYLEGPIVNVGTFTVEPGATLYGPNGLEIRAKKIIVLGTINLDGVGSPGESGVMTSGNYDGQGGAGGVATIGQDGSAGSSGTVGSPPGGGGIKGAWYASKGSYTGGGGGGGGGYYGSGGSGGQGGYTAGSLPHYSGGAGGAGGTGSVSTIGTGSGGGGGGSSRGAAEKGGSGGGTFSLSATDIVIDGALTANGANGVDCYNASAAGGGGGSGGSIALIASNTLTINSGASITARGGNGGDGYNGFSLYDDAGAGGGGGGGGGIIRLSYGNISNNGTLDVSGGVGGTGGFGYGGAGNGSPGNAGGSGLVQNMPPPIGIFVKTPDGGENWTIKTQRTISWITYQGQAPITIALEYSTAGAGGPFTQIASGLADNGSYNWIVPDIPTSVNCYIKATATDNLAYTAYDTSNASFTIFNNTIPPPAIQIIAPATGTNWTTNATHNITWTTTGGNGTLSVNLEYSTNGTAGPYKQIAAALPDNGSYPWFIGAEATSTRCYIRANVTDSALPPQSATSTAGNFTIYNKSNEPPPPVPLSLAVTAPAANANWTSNATHSIKWNATGGNGTLTVKLEYSVNGSAGTYKQITASAPNNGTYSWLIKSEPTSNNCYLRATVTDGSAPPQSKSISVGNFTIYNSTVIPPPPQPKPLLLSVSDPAPGANWTSDAAHDVKWNATGGNGTLTLKLEYSVDGAGGTFKQIAASAPNTGAFSWPITAEPTSNDCYLRATVTDGSAPPQSKSVTVGNFTVYNSSVSPPPQPQKLDARLTIPSGGENWTAGTVHDIIWAVSGGTAPYTISLNYSTDGPAGNMVLIASGITGTAASTWTVPQVPTSHDCYVQITVRDSSSPVKTALNLSAAAFTIYNPAANQPIDHITLIPPGPIFLSIGDTRAFAAKAWADSGETSEITGIAFSWSVTGGIGTVDPGGIFTAASAGMGTVVASSGSKMESATVQVSSQQIQLGSVAITPAGPFTLSEGDRKDFAAVAYDADSQPIGAVIYNWSVTGGIGSASPLVDSQATRFIAGAGPASGKVTVSAYYRGAIKTASVNITIPAPPQITCAIIGLVKDSADGKTPVPSSSVSLYLSGSKVSSFITGANGTYYFPGLAAGSYTISAEADGWKNATISVTLSAGETKRADIAITKAPSAGGGVPMLAIGAGAAVGVFIFLLLLILVFRRRKPAKDEKRIPANGLRHPYAPTMMEVDSPETLVEVGHPGAPARGYGGGPAQAHPVRAAPPGTQMRTGQPIGMPTPQPAAYKPPPPVFPPSSGGTKPPAAAPPAPPAKQPDKPGLTYESEVASLKDLKGKGFISQFEYDKSMERLQKQYGKAGVPAPAAKPPPPPTAPPPASGAPKPPQPPLPSAREKPRANKEEEILGVECPRCSKTNDVGDSQCFWCGADL